MGRDIIPCGGRTHNLLSLGALTNSYTVGIRSDAVLGGLLHHTGLMMLLE